MSNGKIVQLNEGNIEAALAGAVPVLIDFWAPWCNPCKAIAPVLEQAASDYAGRLVVAKVDVDESAGLAARYGVRGIPTLIMVKNGRQVDQQVGATSLAQLQAFIDKNI